MERDSIAACISFPGLQMLPDILKSALDEDRLSNRKRSQEFSK